MKKNIHSLYIFSHYQILLSQVLFDELNIVLSEKDNIDPQLLINSDNSGNLGDILDGYSYDSKIHGPSSKSSDITATSEAEMSEKTRNDRKRKWQNVDVDAITDLFKQKWKDDEKWQRHEIKEAG